MSKEFKPKVADIIVCPGFFARFMTAPGEPPSYAGHIGGFIGQVGANTNLVLHALWHVRTDTWERFKEEHPKGFKVYRLKWLTDYQAERIAKSALQFSAASYGWWRLIAHGADYGAAWALRFLGREGELYFFRRALSDSTKWPLCHEVWARAYGAELGYEFGKPWSLVNPDQMLDWMESNEEWELIWENSI